MPFFIKISQFWAYHIQNPTIYQQLLNPSVQTGSQVFISAIIFVKRFLQTKNFTKFTFVGV